VAPSPSSLSLSLSLFPQFTVTYQQCCNSISPKSLSKSVISSLEVIEQTHNIWNIEFYLHKQNLAFLQFKIAHLCHRILFLSPSFNLIINPKTKLQLRLMTLLQSIPQQQCSISSTLQQHFSHPSLVIYFLLLLLLPFAFANPTHQVLNIFDLTTTFLTSKFSYLLSSSSSSFCLCQPHPSN